MATKREPADAADVAADREALLELARRVGGVVRVMDYVVDFGDDSSVPGLAAIAFLGEMAGSERAVIKAVLLVGDIVTSRALRSVPLAVYENTANLWVREDRAREDPRTLPPLQRGDYPPEVFSQLVARHYRAWAAESPKPAAAISQANDVKLATVHSWIREARLRKLLPPARARRGSDGG